MSTPYPLRYAGFIWPIFRLCYNEYSPQAKSNSKTRSKQNWSEEDFDSLALSLQKLIAPPDILQEEYNADTYDVLLDFEFKIFVNDRERAQENTDWKSILKLAPFQMIGTINSKGVLNYTYKCGEPFREREDTETIDLLKRDSYSFSAPAVKNRFLVNKDGKKLIRIPQQGDISFSFYVYDLRPKSQVLNKRQKDFINTHNVFVFRDGIRVYPFGEKDYDWLELSQRRATEKAGWYYNVNQIIGFVYITGKGNPKLKDTTSRYGMMDVDGAYQDFQALTLGALNAMKAESDLDIAKDEIVKKQNLPSASDNLKIAYASLTNEIIKENNPRLLETANQFLQTYDRHSALINERLETYEDLAGLGLAVEKSSHDAIMVLGKLFGTMRDLRLAIERKGCLQPPIDGLLEDMKGAVDIVYNEMQIIQPLFRQSRRTKSIVNVKEVVEKTIRYFRHDLSGDINVDIQTQGDLLIHTAQGLVLQVLINLIDNAIFWLKEKGPSDKKILIRVNGFSQTVLVADNGIGIDSELSQPIFEAFFSRKDSGRGLGLYIVRELLARIGASITLVNGAAEKALPGANFLIQFDTDPA
jgi:signal transduction histidine kinase